MNLQMKSSHCAQEKLGQHCLADQTVVNIDTHLGKFVNSQRQRKILLSFRQKSNCYKGGKSSWCYNEADYIGKSKAREGNHNINSE